MPVLVLSAVSTNFAKWGFLLREESDLSQLGGARGEVIFHLFLTLVR